MSAATAEDILQSGNASTNLDVCFLLFWIFSWVRSISQTCNATQHP
jgi:hypothetical protein